MFKERRVGDDSLMVVEPDSLAVYLLVDESHSMMELGRYVRAKDAAVILCEALDRLGITFALTGYTASGKLSRILYKQFDENYNDVKTRLLGMRHRVARCLLLSSNFPCLNSHPSLPDSF